MMDHLYRSKALLVSLLIVVAIDGALPMEERSYVDCDAGTVPFDTPPSSLDGNKFHQICPGTLPESVPFGQPICGDGSAYSFLYKSPPQNSSNDKKVILEFDGGGACWDADSCRNNQNLAFPSSDLKFIVGLSCQQAQTKVETRNVKLNLLCNSKFGDTDLSEYNSLFIPYCSQDVHVGDSDSNYAEDYGNDGVYHHGAHNMMSALQWVYTHYPDPSHIFVTGCSAGGTPLHVVYELLNTHYNSIERRVNINVIMDSAVYLTPLDFLQTSFQNWNVSSILDKIEFDYGDNSDNDGFSAALWEHALNRGSDQDRWGFLTHTTDPISIKNYEKMGGGDGVGDIEDLWSEDFFTSLNSIADNYDNVDTFIINGTGHCSKGLYYGLQEDGFDEWAGDIITEQDLSTASPTAAPTTYCSTIPSKRWCIQRGCVWDKDSQTCSPCSTIPGKNLCLKKGCDWDKVSKTCS